MSIYTPQMVTPIFIVQFPHIFKVRPNAGYDICGLFTEPVIESEDYKAMIGELTSICKEQFGTGFGAKDIQKLRDDNKFPLRDAGEKSGEWKGFEPGRKYLNMKRDADDGAPEVVDASFNQILDESQVYPGVLGRSSVKFRAYENKWGAGVSCYFEHFQLMKTGTPRMDNRISAKKKFENAGTPSASAEDVLKDMGIDAQSVDENTGEDLGV